MASARCHCQRGRGGRSEAAGPGLAPGLVLSVPGSCGEGSGRDLTKRDHWTEPRGALVDLPVTGHRSCDPRRGRNPLGREGTGGPGVGTATGRRPKFGLCQGRVLHRAGPRRHPGAAPAAYHVGDREREGPSPTPSTSALARGGVRCCWDQVSSRLVISQQCYMRCVCARLLVLWNGLFPK